MKKIIKTKDTEFEQNLKDYAIIDTTFREGKPILLDKDELSEAVKNAQDESIRVGLDEDFLANNIKNGVELLGVTGTVVELQGEEITVIPKHTPQVIKPSTGKNGITSITIAAIPATLSYTTIPENGATDILIDSFIIITFNNPINLEDSTFVLNKGEDIVTCDISIDSENKIITITPSEALDTATEYALDIEAKDIYDYILSDEVSFTTIAVMPDES